MHICIYIERGGGGRLTAWLRAISRSTLARSRLRTASTNDASNDKPLPVGFRFRCEGCGVSSFFSSPLWTPSVYAPLSHVQSRFSPSTLARSRLRAASTNDASNDTPLPAD